MYYIDNNDNTDPCINLALEEYAVRKLERDHDYLLLYVNQPSLIIGKHQNVIEEVNLNATGELGIPVIRRISGGGAVYHDEGNLNISIITNQTLKNFNKYSNFLKPLLEVLKELSLPVRLNERNNIILDEKKISGNAQFTSKQRLLSHGTLLINSNIQMVNRLLKPENINTYLSKSTKSVRNNVTTINRHLKNSITVKEFKILLLDKIFRSKINHTNITDFDYNEIEKLADIKYKSWQWNYGLSPKCEIKKILKSDIGEIDFGMSVDKGIIQLVILNNPDLSEEQKKRIQRYFENKPLDYISIKAVVKKIAYDKSLSSLSRLPWLEIILN